MHLRVDSKIKSIASFSVNITSIRDTKTKEVINVVSIDSNIHMTTTFRGNFHIIGKHNYWQNFCFVNSTSTFTS